MAAAAIGALGPHDLAAMVTTTGGLTPQTLTSDRARLLRAVNRPDGSQGLSEEQQAIPSVAESDPGALKTDATCAASASSKPDQSGRRRLRRQIWRGR
jgi:hypothetical protein